MTHEEKLEKIGERIYNNLTADSPVDLKEYNSLVQLALEEENYFNRIIIKFLLKILNILGDIHNKSLKK